LEWGFIFDPLGVHRDLGTYEVNFYLSNSGEIMNVVTITVFCKDLSVVVELSRYRSNGIQDKRSAFDPRNEYRARLVRGHFKAILNFSFGYRARKRSDLAAARRSAQKLIYDLSKDLKFVHDHYFSGYRGSRISISQSRAIQASSSDSQSPHLI
jgi:hypothetical protein